MGRRGMDEPGEGAELLLSLVRAGGSRVSILLGAGEAVALAGELIQAARVRNAPQQAVHACYRGKSPAGGEEGPGNAPAR